MLEGLLPRIADVAGRWVTAASRAKGLAVGSPLRGEEWTSGPWALANYVGPLAETLRHVEAGTVAEALADRTPAARRPDGRPRDARRALRPGPALGHDGRRLDGARVTPATLPSTVGTFYQQTAPEGRVALVLGAGNIASIPPLDVLYKLYAEGEVVLLKMNPVNAYLQPLMEVVFAEFVEAGYLRFARRRRGRAVSHGPRRRRRDPHDGERGHARRHRLRDRAGGPPARPPTTPRSRRPSRPSWAA